MDKLVDHLLIFEGKGEIYDFPGNYSDYRTSQKQEELQARRVENQPKEKKATGAAPESEQKKKRSFKEQKEADQLFKEIESLEKEKINIETSLSSGTLKPDELMDASKRLVELLAIMDQKTNRWMELSE
jgi:ATP-binding cassette subfamily F protein uup